MSIYQVSIIKKTKQNIQIITQCTLFIQKCNNVSHKLQIQKLYGRLPYQPSKVKLEKHIRNNDECDFLMFQKVGNKYLM